MGYLESGDSESTGTYADQADAGIPYAIITEFSNAEYCSGTKMADKNVGSTAQE